MREITEAMIIFDDVFVPWNRVFMCGEWQHSMKLAYTFATFHRFTAISYKLKLVEVIAGCGVAMAKYNGLEKIGHIKTSFRILQHTLRLSARLQMQQRKTLSCMER